MPQSKIEISTLWFVIPIRSLRSVQAAEESIRQSYMKSFQNWFAYRPLVPRGDSPIIGCSFTEWSVCLLNSDQNVSRLMRDDATRFNRITKAGYIKIKYEIRYPNFN